jgi:DNA sulfur modification protein DndD
MLIREIILENFGLYQGKNHIPLTPSVKYKQRRPIILIGGQNGAGKTTILEALRLCLYGPRALGERVTQKEYEKFLLERIHRPKNPTMFSKNASLILEFEHSTQGELHLYRVERSWEQSGKNSVHSFLEVTRDGEPLDELEQAHADEFLRDLIPPGVSQLYFFDGEKIQELAEAEDDSETLGDAIRGLLGLDLCDQLSVDLKVYARRIGDSPETRPLKKQIEALTKERRKLKKAEPKLIEAADKQLRQMEKAKSSIGSIESKISGQGGSFASHREQLKERGEILGNQIGEYEDELREHCANLLPFTMASQLCRQLADQLESEQASQAWQAYSELTKKKVGKLKAKIDKTLFDSIKLSQKNKTELSARVEGMLDELLKGKRKETKVELVHRLSDDQRHRLVSAIAQVSNELPKEISKLERKIEKDNKELSNVLLQLKKVPDEDQTKLLLDKLRRQNKKLTEEDKKLDERMAELNQNNNSVAEIDKKLEKLDVDLKKANKGIDRQEMVSKVQSVLADYSLELAKSKAKELTESVANRFMQLWRKDQVINRVEINPETFRVTLFDDHDRPISKKELSAGEKQVYAIAMLWALAEVSGRPLPIVIDTPLGRLDSQHRFHLVEHYFPNASHQVIILSTDTEIDEEHFNEMRSSVSHALNIRYDQKESRTHVEEGYFWKREKQSKDNDENDRRATKLKSRS